MRIRSHSCMGRGRLGDSLLFAAFVCLWATTAAPAEESAADRIRADVEFLADDSMQGRGIGTQGLERAAQFVADRFEELGLKTDLVEGGPYQTFMSTTRVPKVEQGMDWDAVEKATGKQASASGTSEAVHESTETEERPERPKRPPRRDVEVKNVMALLPGEGPKADEIVVVGAHYDHLGYRPRGDDPLVFNGANDNASGTATILEIARILSEREEKLPRSILFIAFSAEERGLVGSFYYVKHPVLPLEKTIAMVNLDMVGCIEGDVVIGAGASTSKLLVKLLGQTAREHDFDLLELPGTLGGSDHIPFYSHEVPAVHLATSGGRQYYHRPIDDVETLDFAGAARVSRMAADLVVALAESEQRPEFKDGGVGGIIVRNLFRFLGAAASAMAEPEEE